MKYLYWMLRFVPVAIAAEFMHAPPLVVFDIAALAILPLSSVLGHATEELAGHTGPTIGGLLNEVVSVGLAVGIATVTVLDAESNWLEGAFLLLVYAIIAVAFFFF